MVSQKDFSDILKQKQILLFVGSGISWSCLPSAAELLELNANIYLPKGGPQNKQQVISEIQPEIFYQELSHFIGEKAISSFDIFDSENVEPSLAHYLVVWFASRASMPVITTNFDTLLEKAAKVLNLQPKVVEPDGEFSSDRGFEIWKAHGTVGKELFALMPQITRPNLKLLEALQTILEKKNICFVGYSGRDVDLFPLIRGFHDLKQPFWIDVAFTEKLKARMSSIHAISFWGRFEKLILEHQPEVISELVARGMPAIVVGQANSENRSPYIQEIIDRGKQLACSHRISPVESDLFCAIALMRAGKHKLAFISLSAHEMEMLNESPNVAIRFLLTMALLTDFLSDYRASEQYALKALKMTSNPSFFKDLIEFCTLKVQALHALAMARKMQLGPQLYYPKAGIRYSPARLQALRVLFLYLWTVPKMVKLLRQAENRRRFYFQRLHTPAINTSVWLLWAWNRFLDHKTVLYALLTASLGKVPFFRGLIISGLKKILVDAETIGDASLIAHTEKQLQQLGQSTEAKIQFTGSIYELTADSLNSALIHRNEADELFKKEDLPAAAKEFCMMLRLAKRCESKATIFKAYVGLYACGKMPRSYLVKRKLNGLTGLGYELSVKHFLTLIKK